ncbi:hypothetical protein B0T26DRAFT_814647 [Lasiosphaeria miniovina]|uniref:Putative lipoate-protein ligase A n=1 Tax=Lasiosphaeria miniovina TaxID=1954250 RepID=A0AA39ZYG4_9PEZI|nr:uncharacterized protein B0T26DRAFT_814647 [Lasiosphaeria miniovina]KAK0705973.1 hypothetical protein B0T26DRAFT_814647 [Lasiosphaeria miniovina]
MSLIAQCKPRALRASRPVQVYRSTSSDPYVNLSIEHFLLQRTHAAATVLFQYVNRPCVVVGRNQNPWLEANLQQVRRGLGPDEPVPVDLVRRRSGGGAVFHDAGNVNWAVVCPAAAFDRDRHAEMVVRALQALSPGTGTPRVNARHDIVLDTPGSGGGSFKISGSAYKLTRLRALHHGTCLLASPHLGAISALLRSPAAPFVKARGVESVRSPVRNAGADPGAFMAAVVAKFRHMYGDAGDEVMVGADALDAVPEIRAGVAELMSPEWIYDQTPQFTLSSHPTDDDPRPRPALPPNLPPNLRIHLTVRHGEIQTAAVSGLRYVALSRADESAAHDAALSTSLAGQRLHDIRDWHAVLERAAPVSAADRLHVGGWLNGMFGLETSA